MTTLTIYGTARTERGTIGIQKIVRAGGRGVSIDWTGEEFKEQDEADAICWKRNVDAAKSHHGDNYDGVVSYWNGQTDVHPSAP